ncbi:hypothetical protein LNL84_10240 [Vibrio sp. ZSDZ34]|uniref:Uncharacterized protein n=1 Tax=Vibrio gelatinilyticus TaxID=2893468 RepID=A0A9X1WAV8_9VIBR|nr:hypothetical protein [Vibrio gelatinilyticus]MCJ2377208.1 hypothetical protein [Vibrio gelatinilyticus]
MRSSFARTFGVVHLSEPFIKNPSLAVNKVPFSSPLSWMKRKSYTQYMFGKPVTMTSSQLLVGELGEVVHQLMRVK